MMSRQGNVRLIYISKADNLLSRPRGFLKFQNGCRQKRIRVEAIAGIIVDFEDLNKIDHHRSKRRKVWGVIDLSLAAHLPQTVPEPEGDHLPYRPKTGDDQSKAHEDNDEGHQHVEETD
jgi:hypothetical protein